MASRDIRFGLKIFQTITATERGGRVKMYPKRKSKSWSHWHRMDKKWLKRYGHHMKPCMYQSGNMIFVHPALYPQLMEALGE